MRTITTKGKSFTYDETKEMPAWDKHGDLIKFVPLPETATMDADDDATTTRFNDMLDQLAKLGSDTVSIRNLVKDGTIKPKQAAVKLCEALGLLTDNADPVSMLHGFAAARLAMRTDNGKPDVATDARATMDGSCRVDSNSTVGRYLAGMKPDYSRLDTVSRYLAERQ